MDYYDRPEISNSDLRYLKKSYADYLAYKENKPEPSKAMVLGTITHALILENKEEFILDSFITLEIGGTRPRSTKKYKEWAAKQEKPILEIESFELLQKMKEVVKNHPLWKTIEPLEKEVELFGEIDGVKCRGKCDAIDTKNGVLYDLKTIADLDTETALKKIRFDYQTQCAFYKELAEQTYNKPFEFVFLFVEKKAPYKVIAVQADSENYKWGLIEIKEILGKFKVEKNVKKGYIDMIGFNEHPDDSFLDELMED